MVTISLLFKDSEKYTSAHFVCTSQPFWKISHSSPAGLPLRFVPWFINQTPKERACGLQTALRAELHYSLLGGGKWEPWETPLPLHLPCHSSRWPFLPGFPAPASQACSVLCRVTAGHQAAYKTCGLPTYSNLIWIPGSSSGALALPASHRWAPAGSGGSFLPTL